VLAVHGLSRELRVFAAAETPLAGPQRVRGAMMRIAVRSFHQGSGGSWGYALGRVERIGDRTVRAEGGE